MTTPTDIQFRELETLLDRERDRHQKVAEAAREAGGIFDEILGRWVEWDDGRPARDE